MIKVKLGSVEHDVPKMNIGQIEDIASIDVPPAKWSFAALAILMRRATPKVADVREIEAEPDEVRAAIDQILRHSGYKLPDPNGTAPEAPGQDQDQA